MFGRAHNGRRDARLDPRQERATVGWEGAAVATGRRIEHEGRKVPNRLGWRRRGGATAVTLTAATF